MDGTRCLLNSTFQRYQGDNKETDKKELKKSYDYKGFSLKEETRVPRVSTTCSTHRHSMTMV